MLEIDKVHCGDCLKLMKEIPDSHISLIYTDPPHFKVKGEAWDHQWDSPDKFIDWIGELCQEWQRILKPNGSLYVFASPKMAARVECEIGKYFSILNNVVWNKISNYTPGDQRATAYRARDHESFRKFFDYSEGIVFAEHFGSDNIAKGEAGYTAKCDELRGFLFEPIRAYLDEERKRAGVKREDCNAACGFARIPGGMASRHYFSTSQWQLPTREHYAALQELFNQGKDPDYLKKEYDYLKKEYDDLKKEYDDLKKEYETLRRPFSVTSEVPYTDVWDFPTVQYYKGKHPCEKPIEMHRHVITASSKPGDVVLDCFGGSCQVADACIQLDRRYIVIEQDAEYVERARRRLQAVNPDVARKRISAVPARLDRWSEQEVTASGCI